VLDRNLLAPHAVAHWAQETPDAPVLVHVDGDRLTYAELLADSRKWATCLRGLGIDAGAHVATLLPNAFEAHRTMLALGWLRAVEVPLNVAYVGEILAHALNLSEATTLVTTKALLAQVNAVAQELPLLGTVLLVDGAAEGEGELATVSLPDELAATIAETDFDGPDVTDVSTLMFTSGTTGPSKAVITPWGLTFQMWSWVPGDMLAPGEALFSAMSLFHNSGRSGFSYVLSRGGCLVTREKFSATSVWDDVRRFDCVALALVGPLTALLYSAPPRDDDADNPVRSVILGPMIPQIADFKKRFGVQVAICYGQTEIGAPVTSGWDHGPWEACGQRRLSWPYHEVRIVDENDESLAPGQVGEMVVRSDEPGALNLGYYGMPDRTAEAWRGGWFHTGDAFREDDDGNFYFVDRMNDAIRRRGENISSFEVEAAVAQHPAVRECAAIGVRTEFGDDEVMAVVLVEDPFEPRELLAFLAGRLPKFMLPRYVNVVTDLPRNATTGRVRKSELRAAGLTASTWDAAAEPPSRLR
jgi:crotonobetaine/carnitine-CoA ligase